MKGKLNPAGVLLTALFFLILGTLKPCWSLEAENVDPQKAYELMYYAGGWYRGTGWGAQKDLYIRFCHTEKKDEIYPILVQAVAYLSNIANVDLNTHLDTSNQRVGSDAISMYIGDSRSNSCCYDGRLHGYTAASYACAEQLDVYVSNGSSFVHENAEPYEFYKALVSSTLSLDPMWSSAHASSEGSSILVNQTSGINVPSPTDDQVIHIASVWRELLPSNRDYSTMARIAKLMRESDVGVNRLGTEFREWFGYLWNDNSNWCPSEVSEVQGRYIIKTPINLGYISGKKSDWYELSLSCIWDGSLNTVVCPLSDASLVKTSEHECSGAFLYLTPFILRIDRVSVGQWDKQLVSGKYLYLQFSLDPSGTYLVLDKLGLVEPFTP